MFRVLLYAVELLAVVLAVRWVLGSLRGAWRGSSGAAALSEAARQAELERGARWETHTESAGGQTSVLVRRVALTGIELGRQTVAAIPDAAPDWEQRYHEAMSEARSRVAALRAQGE